MSSRSREASVGICFHVRWVSHTTKTLDPDTRSLRSLLRDDNVGSSLLRDDSHGSTALASAPDNRTPRILASVGAMAR
jgi:hypothetical protein